MSAAAAVRELVAGGEYVYLCDGEKVAVSESWQLHHAQGTGYEIASARRVPAQGLVIRARARITQGEIQRCLLEWRVGDDLACAARASYRRDEDGAAVYRFARAGQTARSVAACDVYYFPLLRIFSGQLLGALMAVGGRGQVLVPWIHDPACHKKLFEPEFSHRQVSFNRQLPCSGGEVGLDSFRYSGGQYDDGADYLLADGLLREYRWRQGNKAWQVRLENLSGCWPGTALWRHVSCAEAGLHTAGA